MQILFDFLPIVAFVITYKFAGIFVATGVLIVGVLIQSAVQWFRTRKLSPMMLTSAGVVLLFGGITLVLRNETFIQWKPTVANWLFALGFLIVRFVSDKTVMEQALGEQAPLPKSDWQKLNVAWILFFIASGCVNIWLLYSFDLTTWVNLHLIVLLGLTFAFFVGQSIWLARKLPDEPAETVSENPPKVANKSGK